MELLMSLLFKCQKNDLSFSYHGKTGYVDAFRIKGDEFDFKTDGYVKNQNFTDGPEAELKRMHEEVDDYLQEKYSEIEPEETEYAQARLTEQERKMKEAGHSEKDFL